MTSCPICSHELLRHIGHGSIYWFCPHCWLKLPNLLNLESRRQMVRTQEPQRTQNQDSKVEAIPYSA
jgi:hypothetical protein